MKTMLMPVGLAAAVALRVLGGCAASRIGAASRAGARKRAVSTRASRRQPTPACACSSSATARAWAPASLAGLLAQVFPRLHIDDLAQDGTIFEGVVTQLSRGSARSDAVLIQAGGNGVIRLRGDDAMRADIDRAVALTEALRIPEAIAQQAPLAVVATRLNAWRSVEPGPLAAMAEFDTNQQRLANSEDATEGVASFQGRRTARSLGR